MSRSGDATTVLSELAGWPGGRELLLLAEREGPGTAFATGLGEGAMAPAEPALVGGAVRDLLLGRAPRELDVVVAADAAGFAGALTRLLQREHGEQAIVLSVHERFNTALLTWPGGRIDIAERRAESYAARGALPSVRTGSVEQDLTRRDFTVNAIAVPLAGPARGALLCAEHAHEDLDEGLLRVLHERSFLDDPTRLLRLARYSARLDFDVEADTARLAASALAGGALETVSRARIGTELRLALGEADPVAALGEMQALRVLAAVDTRLRLDDALARQALTQLPSDGRPDLLVMASLLLDAAAASNRVGDREAQEAELARMLDALEFTAAARRRIIAGALGALGLGEQIAGAGRRSQLHELLSAHTAETIALAAALAGRGENGTVVQDRAGEWFGELRGVQLEIGGEDLIAAGVSPGPELGRRLAAALAARLDGELPDGREAELQAALRVPG